MSNPNATFGELRDLALNKLDTWRSGGGRKAAMINSGHFVKDFGYSFPAKNITKKLMIDWQLMLEDTGICDDTINKKTSAVSTVLKFAYDMEVIDFQVPRFKRRKNKFEPKRKFYTKEQVELIAKIAYQEYGNKPLGDITLAAAYSGMRQGELLKLKVKDVDLAFNQFHLGDRPDNTTKPGKYRSVPIHRRIKDLIAERIENKGPNDYLFKDDWKSRHSLTRSFKNIIQRYLNFDEGYCFHCLRHSFGHFGVEGDISMRKIQKMMGHANINTTLRYADTSDKSLQDAIDRI
tara:strand:- start:14317 stop:15189 length:873 start_codon:yes stop_codon:yes gene_type:complete